MEDQETKYQILLNEIAVLKEKLTTFESLSKIRLEKDFNNERLQSLLEISEYKAVDTQDLLDFSLHQALKLTQSKFGYIYYYNEETRRFTLNSWSKEVMKNCGVLNPNTLYDLDNTGCWGEAVRQRKPFILNDYGSHHPTVKGTPDGHVSLKKFLTIPVFVDQKIVAVVGVANKESDYNSDDIRQLTLMMGTVWKMVEKHNFQIELLAAKEKAELSDKLKTSFLQNMSHEIRTPMNAIVGFSELLLKQDLDKNHRYYAQIVVDSSQQLLAIINDMLDLSKIQIGEIAINKDIFNINWLLSEIYSVYLPKSTDNFVKLELYKDLNDNKASIIADKTRLRQIFNNLLSNALKYTVKGTVSFGYSIEGNFFRFFVQDNGIGIDSTMHQAIFEPFRQVENEMTRKFGGVGMGLSISKKLVEIMGGTMWVDSELSKGSCFYFTIPKELPVSQNVQIIDNSIDVNFDKEVLILVAEDSELNCLVIKEFLKSHNIKTLNARNGHDAIEYIQSHPAISLVLMDLKMPLMDGLQATREIKKIKKSMPVVAVTAFAASDDRMAALDAGCDEFLSKPFNLESLLFVISKFCK